MFRISARSCGDLPRSWKTYGPIAGPEVAAVVVRPPVGLSTAAVYGRCKRRKSPGSIAPLVDTMHAATCARSPNICAIDLESAAEQCPPWIGRLRQEFQQINVQAAQMSAADRVTLASGRSARHARRVASS